MSTKKETTEEFPPLSRGVAIRAEALVERFFKILRAGNPTAAEAGTLLAGMQILMHEQRRPNQHPRDLSGDELRWYRMRANKHNRKLADRIAGLREQASIEHRKVLREALEQWADKTSIHQNFPEITDLLTSEAIYHLAYCSDHTIRYEREIAVQVAFAIVDGKTAEQCAQIFRSKTAYHKKLDKKIERWREQEEDKERREAHPPETEPGAPRRSRHEMNGDLPVDGIYAGDHVIIEHTGKIENGHVGAIEYAGRLYIQRIYFPDPTHIRIGESYEGVELLSDVKIIGPVVEIERAKLPPDEDGILDADLIFDERDDDTLDEDVVTGQPRKRKPTRRIRVDVKRFERYGIERGDTAIVVMNGDVRVGELGYFAVTCNRQFSPAYYNHFTFVCELDSTCHEWLDNGPLTPESVCLRHDDINKCNGHHNATAYGRVCAIERNRQQVGTTLNLRPFDGRY